ncbi:MAG: Cell wall-associated hydrolase, partial [Veillonella dispar DORA_11]
MRRNAPLHWLHCLSKALDLLVPVSSKPHGSSTPGLSTMSS